MQGKGRPDVRMKRKFNLVRVYFEKADQRAAFATVPPQNSMRTLSF